MLLSNGHVEADATYEEVKEKLRKNERRGKNILGDKRRQTDFQNLQKLF
jgi:hypothetical protein